MVPEDPDLADIAATRGLVEAEGTTAIVIDDLRPSDLDGLAWAGGPVHLESVVRQLGRIGSGLAEYLAGRSLGGRVIGKAGIDYEPMPGVGIIWQVNVHPALQGLGIGSALVAAAEARIQRRGLVQAALSVELVNPDARRLYERLGYRPTGERETRWETLDEGGQRVEYQTIVTDMTKPLGP